MPNGWVNKNHKQRADQIVGKPGQGKSESKRYKMFMPPDENNYKGHGKNNLVLKYEDQTANTIDISPQIHLQSKFCKTYGIEEPI